MSKGKQIFKLIQQANPLNPSLKGRESEKL